MLFDFPQRKRNSNVLLCEKKSLNLHCRNMEREVVYYLHLTTITILTKMNFDPKIKWDECRHIIKQNISIEQYEMLFAYTEFKNYAND